MTEPNQNTDENLDQDINENKSATEETSADQIENQNADKEFEQMQQQVAEYHDKMLRMQAEMENLRKRTERDLSNAHKYAIEKFAGELLQVKDSLELGLGAGDVDAVKLREGTELTLKMMMSVLEKFAIEEIDPIGKAFDPNLHQAMTIQESTEYLPNTVMSVMQKGYTLHDRLLRPAMVIVAKASEEVADK